MLSHLTDDTLPVRATKESRKPFGLNLKRQAIDGPEYHGPEFRGMDPSVVQKGGKKNLKGELSTNRPLPSVMPKDNPNQDHTDVFPEGREKMSKTTVKSVAPCPRPFPHSKEGDHGNARGANPPAEDRMSKEDLKDENKSMYKQLPGKGSMNGNKCRTAQGAPAPAAPSSSHPQPVWKDVDKIGSLPTGGKDRGTNNPKDGKTGVLKYSNGESFIPAQAEALRTSDSNVSMHKAQLEYEARMNKKASENNMRVIPEATPDKLPEDDVQSALQDVLDADPNADIGTHEDGTDNESVDESVDDVESGFMSMTRRQDMAGIGGSKKCKGERYDKTPLSDPVPKRDMATAKLKGKETVMSDLEMKEEPLKEEYKKNQDPVEAAIDEVFKEK